MGQLFSWTAVGLLLILLAALVVRLITHGRAMLADLLNPSAAFGFFTIVAACTVVSLDLGAWA